MGRYSDELKVRSVGYIRSSYTSKEQVPKGWTGRIGCVSLQGSAVAVSDNFYWCYPQDRLHLCGGIGDLRPDRQGQTGKRTPVRCARIDVKAKSAVVLESGSSYLLVKQLLLDGIP